VIRINVTLGEMRKSSRIVCECNGDVAECPTHGDSLTAKIVERLALQRFEMHPGIYHVTETCGCLRRSYLERKQGHDETYEQLWLRQRGSALHRKVGYAFQGWKELPIRMPIQMSSEEIVLVGYVDAYDPEEGEIIEFKSTRLVKWQKKNGFLPHPHHVEQIQAYYSIWTRCYGFPVRRLSIAYMDDQTPPTRFPVQLQDITGRIRERTMHLHDALTRDIIPTPEPRSLCRYCPFKDICDIKTESF